MLETMKFFFILLLSFSFLNSQSQLLGPEPFNSDILVHGTTAATNVWFAPDYHTPISYISSGGCTGGHVGYSGSWNNYWGNFLRLPEINASGMDSLILSFDISHSYFSSQADDWIRFYVWADGGYQKNVSAVRINGANALYDFGVNGKGFVFDQSRTCAATEIVFDLSTIVDKSSILIYLEANCNYDNSNTYFVNFDNISVANAGTSSFAVNCCADTSFCENDAAWTISGSTPLGGVYSGTGISSGVFYPSVAGVGNHSIQYLADDGGGNYDSCTFQIEVLAKPYLIISIMPNDTLCSGDTVTLTASGASGYMWDSGVTNAQPFIPSTQYYNLYTTGANGCHNDTSIYIQVMPIPSVSLNLPWDTLCATTGMPYPQYPLSGGNPGSGYYLGGDVIDSINILGNGILGNRYSVVTYVYTDFYSCSASAEDSVYLKLCLTNISELQIDVSIYPNPASSVIYIENISEAKKVEVYSVDGRFMHEFKNINNLSSINIDILSWSEGIYYIKLLMIDNKYLIYSFMK